MFTEYTTEIVFTIIQYGAESINTGVNPTTDSTFGQGCHQDLPERGGGKLPDEWEPATQNPNKGDEFQKDEECQIFWFFLQKCEKLGVSLKNS